MDDKRPRSREKRVVDGGKDIQKKGQGLGTGPVGSGTGGGARPSGGVPNPLRSGGGRLGMIIVVIIIIFLSRNMFGDAGDAVSYYDTQDSQTAQADQGPSNTFANDDTQPDTVDPEPAGDDTEPADLSVAEGARERFTTIKGDGSDTVTIMVYMCGTDLESKNGMATSDLTEMTKAAI